MKESNKAAMVDAYIKAIRDSDAAALDKLLAPDFTLTVPQPSLEVAAPLDRATAIGLLTDTERNFIDMRTITFKRTNVVETGTDYVVEMSVHAALKKGGSYDNVYVVWYRFADGKIKSCREHLDTAYLKAAMN